MIVSRKTAYIIFSIVLAFLILVMVFFYFLYKKNQAGQYDLNGSLSNSVRDFLPFGNLATTTPSNQNQISTETNNATTTLGGVIPILRQISTAPVAGDEIFDRKKVVIQDKIKKTIDDQYIRFADRATGHIFETKPDNLNVVELSNTTIAKVYESIFSSNPDVAIFRLLDTSSDKIISQVSSLFNPASTTATSTTAMAINTGTSYVTKTLPLGDNIESAALAPNSQRSIYVFQNSNGGVFVLSNIDGSKPVKLYSSALSQWLVDWPNEKYAVITTKPSGVANGISLLINTTNGSLSKVASGNGLTTLVSPDTTEALVGTSGDGSTPLLSSITLKNNTNVDLSLKTLPEKCVWAHTEKSTVYCAVPENIPVGTYPDSWYQGLVSFTDNLWKINTSTGISKIIAAWDRGYGKNFDATKLEISSDDTYLTFVNKNDLILWGYRLQNIMTSSSTATSTKATASSTKSN